MVSGQSPPRPACDPTVLKLLTSTASLDSMRFDLTWGREVLYFAALFRYGTAPRRALFLAGAGIANCDARFNRENLALMLRGGVPHVV